MTFSKTQHFKAQRYTAVEGATMNVQSSTITLRVGSNCLRTSQVENTDERKSATLIHV